MKPRLLVTGVFGQDGSYLAERGHQEGYDVYGVARPFSLLQGQGRYARSCWLGFWDAVAHRMGRGRLLEVIG